MQRRRFIMAACALAATSALPVISKAASRTSRQSADFGFRVGDRLRCDQGTLLEVSGVSSTRNDAICQQYGIEFRHLEGPKLEEGTYRMQGSAAATELFLQPSAEGARAVLSRLI
ncbi:MAG TPA: hypothetical protein VFN25_12635 [Dokdonella sp.]|uniref:hypothetical protein n=1 Tax=Dokdonella sp. TaxID=2291710 RepID=UPI002D80457D|nr:hypothetical protein [Dokdonella sp.]HET9033738.1 hypothetical protein [Dokdonella sp.]